MKRWRQRIDHGDVIESPRGEFVLYEDHAKALSARLQDLEEAREGLANYAQEVERLRAALRAEKCPNPNCPMPQSPMAEPKEVSCKHPTTYKIVQGSLDWCTPCPWCEIEQARQELTDLRRAYEYQKGNAERLKTELLEVNKALGLPREIESNAERVKAALRLRAGLPQSDEQT